MQKNIRTYIVVFIWSYVNTSATMASSPLVPRRALVKDLKQFTNELIKIPRINFSEKTKVIKNYSQESSWCQFLKEIPFYKELSNSNQDLFDKVCTCFNMRLQLDNKKKKEVFLHRWWYLNTIAIYRSFNEMDPKKFAKILSTFVLADLERNESTTIEESKKQHNKGVEKLFNTKKE